MKKLIFDKFEKDYSGQTRIPEELQNEIIEVLKNEVYSDKQFFDDYSKILTYYHQNDIRHKTRIIARSITFYVILTVLGLIVLFVTFSDIILSL